MLAVRIGEKHAGFSVSALHSGELQRLVWYTADEMDGEKLDAIYGLYPELKHRYEKMQVSYEHPASLLVPFSLYDEKKARGLLRVIYGLHENDIVLTSTLHDRSINNIYAVPKAVANWVAQSFPGAGIRHAYDISLHRVVASDAEEMLTVDFRTDEFSLVASRAGSLLLAQTFTYATPADVLYPLVKACREFSFSQETVHLSLSGLIDKESALYRELYQYFLQIQFREPGWQAAAENGESYPPHFFTLFNDLSLCAS